MRRGLALTAFVVMIALWGFLAASEVGFATEWSNWQSVKQASYYGGYGSASGIKAKNKVAVPIERVVSKKKWKRLSKKNKSRYFYYGERLSLQVVKGKHKGKKRTFTVVDCGGFGYVSGRYKGRSVGRWYDLHEDGISGFLGRSEGVCYVRWRYVK